MPHKARVYDSTDPNLPNLPPDIFSTNESDEFSEDERTQEQLVNRKQRRKRKPRRDRRYSETAYSSTAARERVTWEPGIDINTTEVIIASFGSAVTITDYNENRYRVEKVDVYTDKGDSEESEERKDSDKVPESCLQLRSLLNNRPKWSKVRWVNVNGLSWETIAIMGEHFKLHRLAIEDMIDIPSRTKIDFYPDCLFGVVPLTKLVKSSKLDDIDVDESLDEDDEWWKFWKDSPSDDHNEEDDGSHHETINDKYSKYYKMRHLDESFKPVDKRFSRRSLNKYAQYLNNQKPLSYRKLFVGVEQCSFFLLQNGVLLTFFESSGDEIENAILSRITKEETLLKRSCDPSVLLQNILDSIVDVLYPILTAYRKRLNEYELEVLIDPNLQHTQSLHLMSGELSTLRRTILPVSSLMNSFRDLSQAFEPDEEITSERQKQRKKRRASSMKLISPVSEMFFADIVDHTLMFTDDIEGMIASIDNLIGLIFNTISTDTNNAMKQLSVVTVIFLPLSFWTGYYGMNFEKFGDLTHNVSYYWKIAIPFSFGLIVLITWRALKIRLSKIRRLIIDFVQRSFRAVRGNKRSSKNKPKSQANRANLV